MSIETMAIETPHLKRKDFTSAQSVRWCPGCGDFSILAQVQKTFPDMGHPKEDFVFISGIGCSSRFPYYMDTYGFHTIHGRAPAIATGVKLANPHLSVWVATGDGDALSIGGNHFIHLFRRNLDINMILFNNQIYGLTKGQLSPTSEMGKVTKSTPFGGLDNPFNPPLLALGAKATFIARSLDIEGAHFSEILKSAHDHKGGSFIEVYQNCLIFNDNAFAHLSDKETKAYHQLKLEHGKPMLFGVNGNRGIRMDGHHPEVVDLSTGKYSTDDILIHDKADRILALMLGEMAEMDGFPTPMGILYQIEQDSYEDLVYKQIEMAKSKLGEGSLDKLLHSGHTWEVT